MCIVQQYDSPLDLCHSLHTPARAQNIQLAPISMETHVHPLTNPGITSLSKIVDSPSHKYAVVYSCLVLVIKGTLPSDLSPVARGIEDTCSAPDVLGRIFVLQSKRVFHSLAQVSAMGATRSTSVDHARTSSEGD